MSNASRVVAAQVTSQTDQICGPDKHWCSMDIGFYCTYDELLLIRKAVRTGVPFRPTFLIPTSPPKDEWAGVMAL